MDVTFFAAPADLRQWLGEHHATANELWIGFHKKSSGNAGITYQQALDEALCFGWIDGIRKRIDEGSYTIRFTPRRAKSNWSAVNTKRVGELTQLGLMQPSGLKAFNERDQAKSKLYSYEDDARTLAAGYEETFRANEPAWTFFQAQPPSYRKAATSWVMSAKKEETRLKRLATLIADSEKGLRLAQFSRVPRA